MAALNLVVISGLSGSGKSHALKAFEDAGYFCVDNLPPALLPTFVELCHQQGGEIKNVALGIDIRERVFFGSARRSAGSTVFRKPPPAPVAARHAGSVGCAVRA